MTTLNEDREASDVGSGLSEVRPDAVWGSHVIRNRRGGLYEFSQSNQPL